MVEKHYGKKREKERETNERSKELKEEKERAREKDIYILSYLLAFFEWFARQTFAPINFILSRKITVRVIAHVPKWYETVYAIFDIV